MNQTTTITHKAFTIRLTADRYKQLALTAAHLDTTKQDLVEQAVVRFLDRKAIERQITEEETHG